MRQQTRRRRPKASALGSLIRNPLVLIAAVAITYYAETHPEPTPPQTTTLTLRNESIEKTVILSGARRQEYSALIDTGSSRTSIPQKVADEIGVKYTGRTATMCSAYDECLPEMEAVVAIALPFLGKGEYTVNLLVNPKGKDVLVGDDILSVFNVKIDAKTGEVTGTPPTQATLTNTH